VWVRLLLSTWVAILSCCSVHAEPVSLGNDMLQRAVAGKTVHLDTPLGVAVPITYHANGTMSGKAGALEYFLGAEADRGRWWIADGKLCQKWFKWLDAQASCMRLEQDGDKIFWRRDDGVSGTARVVAGLPFGADGAPRALGGPIRAHPSAPKPATVPAKTALLLEIRPAPPVERPPPRSTADEVVSTAHLLSWSPGAEAGWSTNWCRASPHTEDHTKAAALAVAIQLAVGAGSVGPPNACFAAQPALRDVARLDASLGLSPNR
jgi:hypothetical protein